MATDDDHTDGELPYPDDFHTGHLHAAGENRNRHDGAGKSSTSHAGRKTPAGRRNDVRAGTVGDAERAGS